MKCGPTESSTKSDVPELELELFILEVLHTTQYPGKLENLMKALNILGPWDFKWAWWNSPIDSQLSLFEIKDKKSFDRYAAWQAARGMLLSDLRPSFDQLTFKYLNIMSLPTTQETLPEEYKAKLAEELAQLKSALDARIPEFGIQLQVVLGRLQELPEAAWALTDEERQVIVEGFKRNMNVTVFQAAKAASVKGHKIKGEVSVDMF